MKILCINTNGLFNDGITNSILSYYENMDRHGLDIFLLDANGGIDSEITGRSKTAGLTLCYTAQRKKLISYILKTAAFIRREKFDIVHVHGSSALLAADLLAAWLGGCKIRIAHSRNTTCSHRSLDTLLRPLFYRLCNVRFACGREAGKWLFRDREFIVIPNGKDLKKYSFNASARDSVRREHGWEHYTVLGHVGRFNEQKNHVFLLNVFRILAEKDDSFRLALVGTGRPGRVEKIRDLARDLNLEDRIDFLGERNDVPDLLHGMDLMLLPSLYEGLPNVVIEWQTAGLPALLSDRITKECAITDLVSFLPIDQGPECWADMVMRFGPTDRITASRKACEQMRQAGFDIVEDAARLRELYSGLVCDQRGC